MQDARYFVHFDKMFNFYKQIFLSLACLLSFSAHAKPDFSSFHDVTEKKQTFFAYMLPMVGKSNAEIMQQRRFLEKLEGSSGAGISRKDKNQFNKLCSMYLEDCEANDYSKNLKKLLNVVDVIPPSLVIAQAANESAWGASRFAVKGNNYFGQWCFTKGCGMVPSQRGSGQAHEVRVYSSAQRSVESYMRNLNTHPAYEDFRNARAKARNKQQNPTGLALAVDLASYSQRGNKYIHEIQSIIKFNDLTAYDQKCYAALNAIKC